MPVIRTRNVVLIISTAIGLAAASGSAGAQNYDQNPSRLAQFRGFGGGGGAGADGGASNLEDEREKKKREDERRKHDPRGEHQPESKGLRPDSLGSGGGKREDHRGADERSPRTIERDGPPQRPSMQDFRKKEDEMRKGRIEERGDESPRGGGMFGRTKEPPKDDGDAHPSGKAPPHRPAVQPGQMDKRDDHRAGQPGGMFGKSKEPQRDDADAHPSGKSPPHRPAVQPGEMDKRDDHRAGQPGGMFDRHSRPHGEREEGMEKGRGRPHLDEPILPQPSRDEMDARRKDRATFTRGHLGDISKQRQERRDESGRVFFEEPGNRRIVREGGRSFIQHDETERLRRGGRDVREERGPGGERRHSFTRSDGVVIISVHGEDGRLIRRMRRERDGREVVFINNDRERWRRHRGHMVAGFGFSVDLAPPVVRIPREEYYVDAESASESDIYDALSAPPVDNVEADYTLDEIRYSRSLRDRLRRVNLSTINFEFGSWEVTQDQVGRLDVVAKAIRSVLRRNPDAVFLIGGHTDAVGGDEDNLSLSDRRAESVAQVLTDEYGVPAENLTTQGYGEQQLLVETEVAERRNRRVEFQNITPLLARGNH